MSHASQRRPGVPPWITEVKTTAMRGEEESTTGSRRRRPPRCRVTTTTEHNSLTPRGWLTPCQSWPWTGSGPRGDPMSTRRVRRRRSGGVPLQTSSRPASQPRTETSPAPPLAELGHCNRPATRPPGPAPPRGSASCRWCGPSPSSRLKS